jgi:hypothetical protein
MPGLEGVRCPAILRHRKRLHSRCTNNRGATDNGVVTARTTAMVSNPRTNEPVAFLIQPIRNGPKNPPSEPIVEMKASPPAAPRPVRQPVGTVLLQRLG